VKIVVRRKHIRDGSKGSRYWCPIALALRELGYGMNAYLAVEEEKVTLGGYEFALPRSARRFIVRFDDKKPVKPFTFRLVGL
jgi:hypothetical protein